MATFFMSIPIKDAIGFFHDFIKFEKRFSVHTITAYTDDLEHFSQFLHAQFAVEQLDQIHSSMIRTWMAAFAVQKITPRTINRKISTLKSFFKYCLVREWIAVSPAKTIQVLKTKKRLPTYIESDQMDQLSRQDHFSDDLDGRMEYLVVNLLYQTGMRVSELVHLKSTQIELYINQNITNHGFINIYKLIYISLGNNNNITNEILIKNINLEYIDYGNNKKISSSIIFDLPYIKKFYSTTII